MRKSSKVLIVSRLKELFKDNIFKKYSCNDIDNQSFTIKKDNNNELMKSVEQYILDNYPLLTKTLRCDYRHSESSEDTITLVFKVTNEDYRLVALQEQREHLKQMIDKKLKELDEWEIESLNANLRDEGLPEFEV
jgi:hypothetical protein